MKRNASIRDFFRKNSKSSSTQLGSVPDSPTTRAAVPPADLLGSPESPPTSTPGPSSACAPAAAPTSHMDVGLYITGAAMSDDLRLEVLLNPWKPPKDFPFPVQVTGGKRRCFRDEWCSEFSWLCYSGVLNGALCKYCVLFATKTGHGKGGHEDLGKFVSTPYRNWKKIKEDCKTHAEKPYHKTAIGRATDFEQVMRNKRSTVAQQVVQQSSAEAAANKKALTVICEALVFCGRQELALRGSDEAGRVTREEPDHNDGNFRALLRFRILAGDKEFEQWALSAPRNALYTSPTVQNEFIDLLGKDIQRQILERILAAKFFSVLADETTDIGHISQLSLCFRYVDVKILKVREDFVKFCAVKDVSARGLTTVVCKEIQDFGLDLYNMRGQGYDGAATMSGRLNGVQAEILAKFPKAVYTHCVAHCLNLALNDASKVREIASAFGTVRETCTFFNRSSKRTASLQDHLAQPEYEIRGRNLRKYCATRWVERHESVSIFVESMVAVVETLEYLEQSDHVCNSEDSSVTPFTLHKGLCNFGFIISIHICDRLMAVTYRLSQYLQTVKIDLHAAMEMVSLTVAEIQEIRSNDNVYDEIYKKAVETAAAVGVEPSKPRTVGTQKYRSNIPSDSPYDHWKRNVFTPYVDYLLQSFHDRFVSHSKETLALACLLPREVVGKTFDDVKPAVEFYASDLEHPSDAILQTEFDMWQRKWRNAPDDEPKPRYAIEALSVCNRSLFPNVFTLLQLLATLPVSTASVERSFSTLKRLKSFLRNSMSNSRLTGLALMCIHRELKPRIDRVIAIFEREKCRRLSLS